MPDRKAKRNRLFDDWPEKYDKWFETPTGALVKNYESELLLDMLRPEQGEIVLDVGCGTGVFTLDILSFGPHVIGLDISRPMVVRAYHKLKEYPFSGIIGDMMRLPFADDSFDKVVSMTAIEFVKDAKRAVKELFRVTKRGGRIVVTTLNSLSPWAARRMNKVKKGPSIFEKTIFRSPDDIRSLASINAWIETAVHFQKDDDPGEAHEMEREGRKRGLMTGAFLAAQWIKP
jgi:ubiquinone/menaquinone biosynthesis C-methylase UbiE